MADNRVSPKKLQLSLQEAFFRKAKVGKSYERESPDPERQAIKNER